MACWVILVPSTDVLDSFGWKDYGFTTVATVSCVYIYIPTFEPVSIGIGSRMCRRTNNRMYLDMPSSCYNRLHFDFTKRLISIEFFNKCSLCYAQDMQNSMHLQEPGMAGHFCTALVA